MVETVAPAAETPTFLEGLFGKSRVKFIEKSDSLNAEIWEIVLASTPAELFGFNKERRKAFIMTEAQIKKVCEELLTAAHLDNAIMLFADRRGRHRVLVAKCVPNGATQAGMKVEREEISLSTPRKFPGERYFYLVVPKLC